MRKRFRKIYIEITNICNLNCHFCPKTNRIQEFMPLDLFKTVIKQSSQLTNEITLHIMGEPLLHPNLNEIIHLAQTNNVNINLTTNGTVIEKHFKTLLNESIKKINFSIHGLKANFSEKEQKKHLLNIIDFTKFAQSKRNNLVITYRFWNVNDKSNKEILQFIEKEFNITLQEQTTKGDTQIMPNTYIHYDTSFDWPEQTKNTCSQEGYCHALSTHIGILVDGTVIPCCLDNNANLKLGNIKNNTIKDILSQNRAQKMLKGFKERKLVESMCQKCTFIKRLERNK